MAPNRMDTTPDRPSSHSLRISLRKRIAAMTWNTPAASAQKAMMYSSTNAVSPGHRKVTMPAATPSRPTMINAHSGLPLSRMRIPAISASTPSTSANAPQTSTNADKVMAGMNSAINPNRMAMTPRKAPHPQ
ncbi:hypothetical protein G6F23_015118 [Rhizopus arrhizus]|nr:hypothetical protein G6F23_015118 [Rhizopus arrhizus]